MPNGFVEMERQTAGAALTDEEIVQRVIAGDGPLFEIIMRRYNRRLYRVTRSIVANDHEAEDVIQHAYVHAYEHLTQFEGRARFSTWLTKIAIYEAYSRVRRFERRRVDSISALEDGGDSVTFTGRDPEQQTYDAELKRVLEQAFDALPADYKSVFMLREIEGLSTSETAECLDITEENVKTRLHRARGFLQRELYAIAGSNIHAPFQFLGERCDRIVAAVLERIQRARPAQTGMNR